MRHCFSIFAIIFLAVFNLTAQNNVQPPEIEEAEQLSAQVVNLYQAGKFDQALPLAERALILREKALGTENEPVAFALRNLAEVQAAKKKNKEAEATFDRYLNVYGKVAGENNAKFISALDRYVCLLVGINRRDKALEIQKRLYKLDNKFDFDETAKTPVKQMEMAGLMAGKIDKLPRPEYSAQARQAGISGSVLFKVVIDETGKVTDLKPLCGHPLLVKGAEMSLRQAQYKPTIIAGQKVKVIGIAIYNFVR